ncbi:Transcription factor IIIC, putative zinc-finger [Penicillium expansum]|uniref:Transcription factor IIIC, putative zinc-finger n=1 Tax=Penicillium expansum TaxID=27334 RepID=A0A0A2J002_PENEN|nr:Transcription factor IIIC, putative zinc-finger [Penicillium expansum]KGO48126.1 Transcription factor IIIC, putative zinc-finger [Penicillium expansum]KGO59878.1 Transcription factor IIIC, putative zinc-finger [Penicillium expansum]KGO69320.1 Transcription factor IIIC, putative zinc-finger [Penicillium expansum]
MLNPVALSLSPSCHDAISWSPDGELAIAAGEYFQILTPKNSRDEDSAPNSTQDWLMTRVRANLFTNSEWPNYLPGNRDDFSVAADLSESNVVGLAWSPAGLGKYRRSVLAVLTSNLVLSLWEPIGLKKQWTRVAVANHVFWSQLQPSQDPNSHAFRKVNIRSFTWCESLKPSTPTAGSSFLHSHESRWGIPLLTVVNDFNEVMVVQVRRSDPTNSPCNPYDLRILALHSLTNPETKDSPFCSGSLFEKAVKERQRTTALCCGPWQTSSATSPGNFGCAVAMIAAVCGTQLRLIKLEVTLGSSLGETSQQYTLATDLIEHPLDQLNEKWAYHNITGPLRWLHVRSFTTIALAVGAMAGLITITMPYTMYTGSVTNSNAFEFRDYPIYEPETEDSKGKQARHLEPIFAMLTSINEQSDTCKLHLGTLGGIGLVTELHQLQSDSALQQPKWKRMIEEFQDDYDLEHDLGGMSVSRIWGLTAYRNITAAIFTSHPTDMIEYRITSDDRSMIVFSEEGEPTTNTQALFAAHIPDGQASNHNQIREVIRFVLPGEDGNIEPDTESQRLIYAVACRAIVGEEDKSLRLHTRRSLERLAVVTGADLSDEISKCNSNPTPIFARNMDQVAGPGGHIYEKCEVCDAAIGWPSAQLAQCANGHLWERCGLSFLAIQEPGISKYCFVCRKEALDEERVACMRGGKQGRTFDALFETFDICLGCAAKFQASY